MVLRTVDHIVYCCSFTTRNSERTFLLFIITRLLTNWMGYCPQSESARGEPCVQQQQPQPPPASTPCTSALGTATGEHTPHQDQVFTVGHVYTRTSTPVEGCSKQSTPLTYTLTQPDAHGFVIVKVDYSDGSLEDSYINHLGDAVHSNTYTPPDARGFSTYTSNNENGGTVLKSVDASGVTTLISSWLPNVHGVWERRIWQRPPCAAPHTAIPQPSKSASHAAHQGIHSTSVKTTSASITSFTQQPVYSACNVNTPAPPEASRASHAAHQGIHSASLRTTPAPVTPFSVAPVRTGKVCSFSAPYKVSSVTQHIRTAQRFVQELPIFHETHNIYKVIQALDIIELGVVETLGSGASDCTKVIHDLRHHVLNWDSDVGKHDHLVDLVKVLEVLWRSNFNPVERKVPKETLQALEKASSDRGSFEIYNGGGSEGSQHRTSSKATPKGHQQSIPETHCAHIHFGHADHNVGPHASSFMHPTTRRLLEVDHPSPEDQLKLILESSPSRSRGGSNISHKEISRKAANLLDSRNLAREVFQDQHASDRNDCLPFQAGEAISSRVLPKPHMM